MILKIIPILIYIFLYPILVVFHFGNSIESLSSIQIIKKEKNENDSPNLENQYETLTSSFNVLPILYIFLTICFLTLAFFWGFIWQSPTKLYYYQEIKEFLNPNNYSNIPIPSQFCSMNSKNLSITQLYALPSLMYHFNRARSFNSPLNQNQLNNIKTTFKLIFGEKSSGITFNYSTLTEWGIQINMPLEIPINNKKYLTIQIYSGYRSPFDWAMFIELFVQQLFSDIFEGIIPGYSIAANILENFLINLQILIHSFSESSSTASKIAQYQYYLFEKNPADVIVGQGIGGYFAKYVSAQGGMTVPSFSFDSLRFFGSLSQGAYSTTVSDSIVNVYSSGLYSQNEDQLNLNFKRQGPINFWTTPNSFFAFCNTVAQCSESMIYHSFCMQTNNEFYYLLEEYSR